MSNLEYNIRNCALWVSRLCRPVRSDEQGTRAESRWVLWPGANTGTTPRYTLTRHSSQLLTAAVASHTADSHAESRRDGPRGPRAVCERANHYKKY